MMATRASGGRRSAIAVLHFLGPKFQAPSINERHRRLPDVDFVLDVARLEANITDPASTATLAAAANHLSGDSAREYAGIQQRQEARSAFVFCDASATLKEAEHGHEFAA
jgi:hypothetical protein